MWVDIRLQPCCLRTKYFDISRKCYLWKILYYDIQLGRLPWQHNRWPWWKKAGNENKTYAFEDGNNVYICFIVFKIIGHNHSSLTLGEGHIHLFSQEAKARCFMKTLFAQFTFCCSFTFNWPKIQNLTLSLDQGHPNLLALEASLR